VLVQRVLNASTDVERLSNTYSLNLIRKAVGPNVDGVNHRRVGPGIEFVSRDEQVERPNRDALNSQTATTAMLR